MNANYSVQLPVSDRAVVVVVGSGSAGSTATALAAQRSVALSALPVHELQSVLRANGALFSGATTPATPGRTA